MKNIFMYVIVILVIAVGIWLFTRKGGQSTSLYSSSGSPSVSPSATLAASSEPSVSPQGTPVKTADGLEYQDVVVGTGAAAKAGNTVSVNYTGMLTNGTVFDSNVDPKFGHVQPFQFQLGAGQVIKGWDEGVAGMKVGGKRELLIPASLAYGSQAVGNGLIPANSTLIFQVELLGIK